MSGRIEDIYELSPLQQGMLFHTLYTPGSGVYCEQIACQLAGELDEPAFFQAWDRLVARHAVLRTAFHWEGVDKPLQVVYGQANLPWAREDWRGLSPARQEERLQAWLGEDRSRGFDLATAPLLRLAIFRTDERRWQLALTFHHLLMDGWCLPLLFHEVGQHYLAAFAGETPRLPRPTPYREYITWLQEQDMAEPERFWRRELVGFRAPTPLPGDHGRLAAGSQLRAAERHEALDTETTDALVRFARQNELTLNTLIQGAWACLLARSSGERDVVFGATVSGRPAALPEAESMIGLFINTLPVRAGVDPAAPVVAWLQGLQDRQLEVRQHEHASLAAIQGWSEVPRGLPLFESLVVFENYPVGPALGEGNRKLAISNLRILELTSYPLALLAVPRQRLGLRLTCDPARFDAPVAARLLGHLGSLLSALPAAAAGRLADLPHLAAAERHQVLFEWNDTAVDYGIGYCLHERIEVQTRFSPESPAVVFEGRALSYAELDRVANRLAHRLRAMGCEPGTSVAVLMERSLELPVALLGILKAGGAYLPLDPDHPGERLAWMLADAAPPVLLAPRRLLSRLPAVPLRVLEIEEGWQGDAGDPDAPPAPSGHPGDLAYVLYTSGSTGRPKGVMISHQGIVNRLLWMQQAYRLEPGDRILQKTPFSFDVSVWEFFWPLMTGATLVVAPPGVHRDSRQLADLIHQEGVTVLHFVPSMLQAFLAEPDLSGCSSLRLVVASGEALAPELRRRCLDHLPARLENLYGPTEASVDVTWWSCAAEAPGGIVPIGRPIANLRIHLLDADLQLVAVGVPGELHIAGVGLARGYRGRPDLTAERFLPDSHGGPGERSYRTGDLARRLPDGAIEFLGRIDHQVKIRGLRIELGEIEVALASQPGVREAVVAVRSGPSGQRLTAYLVPAAGADPSVPALREALGRLLPDYMMPATWVLLPALPLSPNGKVDRKALPEPDPGATVATAPYVAPITPAEEALTSIWAEVLGVDRVGVHDNFFSLGGDSILSLRLLGMAREVGLRLELEQVFRHPTIRELTRLAAGREIAGDLPEPFALVPETDRPRLPKGLADAYPLSRLQAGMLFHSELDPQTAVYHDILTTHLAGPFAAQPLRGALERLVARHPVLRTSFDLRSFSEPLQLVHTAVAPEIAVEDLRDLPPEAQEGHLAGWMAEEKARPFAWDRAPLFRLQVHLRGADTFQLSLAFHHTILDGWSLALLLGELLETYLVLRRGEEPAPTATDEALRHFVALERSTLESPESRRYWREALAGATVTTLPRWRSSVPAEPRRDSAGHGRPLPEKLSVELARIARREGLPLKSILLAAHLRVLSLLAGRTDTVTGLVCNGRPEAGEADRSLGLFLNTLPLRVVLADGSWQQLARRAFDAELASLPHRRYPLADLQRETGGQPLFEAVFNFVHFHVYQRLAGLDEIRVLKAEFFEETNFVFLANFTQQAGGSLLHLRIEHDPQALDVAQIASVAERYERALAALAAAPDANWAASLLLTEAEQHQVLREWNDTADPGLASDTGLHSLFEIQAARAPHDPAVTFEGRTLDYAALVAWSGAVARQLRDLGCGPESSVGVFLERSLELVVALLAVLRTGGVYVPLDPESPRDRLAAMLDDARPVVLLTQELLRTRLPEAPCPVVDVEAEDAPGPAFPARSAEVLHGLQLAYSIFTSGSTGRPKAALLHHRGIVNRILWMQRAYNLTPADKVLQKTPFTFDVSVWEFFWPLVTGAHLVVARPGDHRDNTYLARLIGHEGITVLHFVPSMLQAFLDEPDLSSCASLRLVVASGEALPAELERRFFERLPHARLENLYGPTEASVDVTSWACNPLSMSAVVPIGRPVANTRIHILDERLEPALPGVPGELWIGGVNVGRGYLGRPDLTAERFGPDPFSPALGGGPGGRLYRTGDLARLRLDGAVEFLGRLDHQVKVRGFRIELGEIEAALAILPGVREAVVMARGERERTRLVAYLVPEPGCEPSVTELRRSLGERLPDYMIPAAWTLLPSLPLTTNGKLDRRALPEPDSGIGAGPESVAPRTGSEEVLAVIWEETLDRQGIGVHDSFFDLGGHSLLATQVMSRVRAAFRLDLPLRALFEAPTIAALATRIDEALQAGSGLSLPPLRPVPRAGDPPLSFAQQRLWFLQQLEPENAAYNMPFALRLGGALDVTALAGSLSVIACRHETLRTTFPARGGEPVQSIAPPAPLALPLIDVSALPAAVREPEAEHLARAEAARPFDLARPPVVRQLLLRLDPTEHALVFTVHHISADEWSLGVLTRELIELYEAATEGREARLSALPVQYADFATWQRGWMQGDILDAQIAYWREQLAGAPAFLDLPTDRPRPPVQTFRGRRQTLLIPAEAGRALRALGRREGVTPFMLLLAAFQVLLHRASGQDTVVVGTPIANRNHAEVEGLIGFFVNTLALRADCGDDPSFLAVLHRVRESALGAYAHQDLPFERLVDALRPERDMSRAPVFQAMFVFQAAPVRPLRLRDLDIRPFGAASGVARFELTLACAELPGGGLSCVLDSNCDLFEEETTGRLLRYFVHLLAAAAARPAAAVSDLPLLDEAEAREVLSRGNGPFRERPALCLHQLFREQAARTPDALAVVSEPARLTYRELDRLSGEIAAALTRRGVGPESVVAVGLERSPEALAALLGVLRAGGAYLPLDVEAPRERLAAVVADAGASILLTRERLAPALAGIAPHLLKVDTGLGEPGAPPAPLDGPEPEPDHPAYVIYTSGTTGAAKGVVVTHRAAVNFTLGLAEALELGPGDGLLLFAPLSFDASVLQIFPALARGAAVAVHPSPRELAGGDLLGFCARLGVTVLDLPAAVWRQWVETAAAQRNPLPACLRAFLTGGESIPVARLRTWAGLTDRSLSFLSSYGPTEATVTSTTFQTASDRVHEAGWSHVPIGAPLPNTRAYVLDRWMRPVPPGVRGELFLAGAGLARGYLGRPDLTAASFIPDPVSGEPGGRVYRTGDLARLLSGGNLEFLGRADHQVKIRGFRVELAEIEAELARHPAVREAAVALREDRPGDKRLVAYAVPGEGRQLPAVSELRAFLAERLPQYMLPSAFVPMPSLPVLASGKVDRAALPAPEADRPETGSAYVASRTVEEEILAGIWAQVLGIERVGIHDNFFALGGDSILSIQIVARAAGAGLRITPRQLFERQTVAALAEVAEAAAGAGGEQGPVTGPAPLLPIQRWFFEEGFAEPHHFNQAVALAAREPLDGAALTRAVAALHVHHDALRLRFSRGPEGWSQAHALAETDPVVTCADLSALPAARQAEARTQAAAQVQGGFDLAQGPLARLVHFSPGPGVAGRLVWAIQHLVVDGVSWRVLLEDLETAYSQASRGLAPALPPKTTSYKSWAERLASHARSEALAGELEHWTAAVRKVAPRLPVDFSAGLAANTVGSEDTVSVELSREETQALLQKVPALYRTEINDALLAALAQALAPWTGAGVLRVDLEGHGREELFPDVDLSRTVGWLTTQFPVVVDVTGAAGPGAALIAVKGQLRAVPGRGLGYGLLRHREPPESTAGSLATAPRSEISFNYLGQLSASAGEPPVFSVAGDAVGPLRSPGSHRTHLLEVAGLVAGGHLQLALRFSTRVHRRSTIERLATAFAQALRDLLSQSDTAREPVPAASDFPMARLNEKAFHKLLAQLGEADSLGASSR